MGVVNIAAISDKTTAEPVSSPSKYGWSRRGYLQPIAKLLVGQSVLFLNAGWLTFGSTTSAILGFFYWLLAAHFFPPAAVGYAAAALSLMYFIGELGDIGFGPLLMGNMQQLGARRISIIRGALLLSFAASTIFAVGFVLLRALFSVSLGAIFHPFGAIMFTFACGLSSVNYVLDQAMAGVLRSELTASRNLIFAITKLVLLAVAPLILSANNLNEVTLFATWFIGQIVALISLLVMKNGKIVVGGAFDRPNFGFFQSRVGALLRHHGLTIASMGALLLPFLVTIELAPETNAAFNAAWTMINVAFLAPHALSLSVFAVGSKDPSGLAHQVRAALGVSLAIAIVVALICYFGAFFILSVFSRGYAVVATPSFKLLAFSIFPMAIRYHYNAIQRVQGRMAAASVIVAIGSALELLGAISGGLLGGLIGLTLGWLLGLVCTSMLMAPAIIRCAFL